MNIRNAIKMLFPNMGVKIVNATRFLTKEALPQCVKEAFGQKANIVADTVQINRKLCNVTKTLAQEVLLEAKNTKMANKRLVTGNLIGLSDLRRVDWKCMLYSPKLSPAAVDVGYQSLSGVYEQSQFARKSLNNLHNCS